MEAIDNKALEQFRDVGHFTARSGLTEVELGELRTYFSKLYFSAKNPRGKYKVRVYDDFPYVLCKGLNLATVEDFAWTAPRAVLALIDRIGMDLASRQILGAKDISLSLFRMHVTSGFAYSGPWHRDQPVSAPETDVLCNLYLYDESGMNFLDKKSSLHTDGSFSFGSSVTEENVRTLCAKAGDVVYFDPKVIHKPEATYQRMHLHFRYTTGFVEKMNLFNYRNYKEFYQRDVSAFGGVKRSFRFLKRLMSGDVKKIY